MIYQYQYLTEEHIVGMTYFGGKLRRGWNPKNKIKDVGPEGWDFGEEITYEQFKEYVLGEKFILPDKWCIKVTNANKVILENWRTDGSLGPRDYDKEPFFYLHTPMHERNGYNQQRRYLSYTEITLEQFIKYVTNTVKEEDYSYLIPIFKNLQIT